MRHYYNKVHVFLVLKIAFNLLFELTFYDSSKFVFFFNLSEKRKLDFINFDFVFFILVLLPAFPPLFSAFPLIVSAFPSWFPAFPPLFPHYHTDSPRSPPDFPHSHSSFPTFPHSHPDSQHSHPYSLHSHPHSPHSPHSVPRFLIAAFTDSPLRLSSHFCTFSEIDNE